jgi:hypothetical protein
LLVTRHRIRNSLLFFFPFRWIWAHRKKKKKKKMKGGFYATFCAGNDQVAGRSDVDNARMLQVLAECTAAAIIQGHNEAFPDNLPDFLIPEGFKRCTGSCKRVLHQTTENFQRDSNNKKSGLKARCKLCVKGEECGSSSVKEDETFCDRLSRLVDYHAAVNAGSWLALLEAQGRNPAFEIPAGWKRCTGRCQRVLLETDEFFSHDKRLSSGFRARCKRCAHLKRERALEEEEEEELELVKSARIDVVPLSCRECLSEVSPVVYDYGLLVCPECISKVGFTANELLCHQEMSLFHRWLDARRDFRWVPAGDADWHLFSAVWTWLNSNASRLQRSGCTTRAGLIKKVAKEVLAVASDDESVKVWKEISNEVGAIKRHSKSSSMLNLAWPALARLFDWMQVVVWDFPPGSAEPVGCEPVGSGDNVLNVIRFQYSNPEFDLLEPVNGLVMDGCEGDLNKDGYAIYRSKVPLSELEVEALKKHAQNPYFETLFNTAGVDDEENDGLRKQIPFSNFMADDEVVSNVHNRINTTLSRLFLKHHAKDMVLLRSDPGCGPQLAHTDYTQTALRMARDDCMPLGCVIGLMKDTALDLWPGAIRCFDAPRDGRVFRHKRVILQPGDLLVFRGDLVHGGAAFDKFNIRLHTFLDVRGVLRNENDTQPMHQCDYILPRDE